MFIILARIVCSAIGSVAADVNCVAVVAVSVALRHDPALMGNLPRAWRKIRRGLVDDARADHGGCAGCSGEAKSERQ
jgi:hypothetical protein